jgi:biofilm PGA synthesis protein PgaD
MWLVYSYLWAPLISLVAWLLGFEFAYDVMVRAGGFETLKEVIWFYLIVVAIIFVVVAGWSTINRRRFARHDRRQTIDSVPDTEIAVSIEASILDMDEESARSVGPEGAVADNETNDDNDENQTLIQGSV